MKKIIFILLFILKLTISSYPVFAENLKLKFNIYNLTEIDFEDELDIELINNFYNELFKNFIKNNSVYNFNLIILDLKKINNLEINKKLKAILKKLYNFNDNDLNNLKKLIINRKIKFIGFSIFQINGKIIKNLILYTGLNGYLNNVIICEVFNSLNNFFENNYFANFIGLFNPYLFNESISSFLSNFLFEHYMEFEKIKFDKNLIEDIENYENIVFDLLTKKYIYKFKTVINFDEGQDFKNYFLKENIYKDSYHFHFNVFLFQDFWIYLIKKYGFLNFKNFIFNITLEKVDPMSLFLSIYKKEPVFIFDEWLNYLKKRYDNYNKKRILYNCIKVL